MSDQAEQRLREELSDNPELLSNLLFLRRRGIIALEYIEEIDETDSCITRKGMRLIQDHGLGAEIAVSHLRELVERGEE